jgi:hypothetical protein
MGGTGGRRGSEERLGSWTSIGAAVTLALALPACTSGAGTGAPHTPEAAALTTIAEARALPRLDPPGYQAGEVSRLTVRAGEAGSFTGRSLPTGVTTVDARYRVTGRCLADGSGESGAGVLVVEIMGPARGGVDGAPSEPAPGAPVASARFPCGAAATSVDLPPLPAGSSELMPSQGTEVVAVGWVVLSLVP